MSLPDWDCNWQSGGEFRAWWIVLPGGSSADRLGVATQGMSANKRVQQGVNGYISQRGTGRLPRWPTLPVDGIIGEQTLNLLAECAVYHNIDQPGQGFATIAERIRADSRGRTISELTWRFALWLAYIRGPLTEPSGAGRGWESIQLGRAMAGNPGSNRARFGVAPDSDTRFARSSLTAVTWNLATQTPPVPRADFEIVGQREGTGTGTGTGAAVPRTSPSDAGGASSRWDETAGADAGASSSAGFLGMNAGTWLLLGGGAVALYALTQGKSRGRRSRSRGITVYRRRSR